MVIDDKLVQGKIVELQNSKAVLSLFNIEYDLNHVPGLEADFLKIISFLKGSEEIFEKSIFR